jgi:hypothetical protein
MVAGWRRVGKQYPRDIRLATVAGSWAGIHRPGSSTLMPAPRVPTSILKLRGADKKNPARIKERENEPVPKASLGGPPRHLNTEERRCWRELVRTAPYGVLADCDRWEVELASCLMAQYRADRAAMPASRLGLLHSVLGKFGFNPSDRSRVQVAKPKADNPFDDDW